MNKLTRLLFAAAAAIGIGGLYYFAGGSGQAYAQGTTGTSHFTAGGDAVVTGGTANAPNVAPTINTLVSIPVYSGTQSPIGASITPPVFPCEYLAVSATNVIGLYISVTGSTWKLVTTGTGP